MSSRTRFVRTSLLLMLLSIVLLLVVFSPLMMRWLSPDGEADWSQLSNVGQAYGGVSAVLSALAICGVGLTLILQNRQTRAEQLVALKNRQLEIIRMGLENPALVIRDDLAPEPLEMTALGMHCNLWVQNWNLMWELDFMSDAAVRGQARLLFLDERRHAWWEKFGPGWHADSRFFKNGDFFVAAIDQGYQDARRELAEARAADEPERSS